MVSLDDQVKAYVKKIMSQLNKWIQKSKISKLVIVITSKETGEHLERWQFDVSVKPYYQQVHHADIHRSTSSTTRASQRKSPLPKARRTRQPRTATTPLLLKQLPPPRRQRQRSSKKSSRFSVKSPLPSLSCRCSTATAHSTCWCTPMPIVTCRSSGATVTRRRSRTPRRSC